MREESLSVLVVEDEANLRFVTATFIEGLGLTVFEADDADKALTVLQEHSEINLVFTDIQMPGSMNGVSLVLEIAKLRPKVEIIVTSGKETPDELPEHGTFLPKPYLQSRLKAMIEVKLIANGF